VAIRYKLVCCWDIGRHRLYRPGPPIRELALKKRNIGYEYIDFAEKEVLETTNHDLSLTKTTYRKYITQFTRIQIA